jgi:hypothetical protein
MRMAKELEILDLPLDLADHVQALDLLSVEDLDRHLVQGCGSGSRSVSVSVSGLDPDSIGSVDPDPGGQK